MKRMKSVIAFLLIFLIPTISYTFAADSKCVPENYNVIAEYTQGEAGQYDYGKTKVVITTTDEEPGLSSQYKGNEFDRIRNLRRMSDQELETFGMDRKAVLEMEDQFDAAIEERAVLSGQELMSLGYGPEEIAIFRKYSQGAVLSEKEYRSISGTCIGNIDVLSYSARSVLFYYQWTWDHCPLITASDSAAASWRAYNSAGGEVDVLTTSLSGNIDYYYGSSYKFTRQGTFQQGLEFNYANLMFPVQIDFVADEYNTQKAYAKTGKVQVKVTVDDSVQTSINYLKVAGLYGHTIIGILSPTLNIGADGLSFSFSGGYATESIAGVKVRIAGLNDIVPIM